MAVPKPVLTIFLLGAAISPTLAGCRTTQQAGECEAMVSASAEGSVKIFTLAAARDAWRDKAGGLYGQKYKHLNRAKNKTEDCAHGSKWSCGVSAEPCHN